MLMHNSGGNGQPIYKINLSGRRVNRDAMPARVGFTTGADFSNREIAGWRSYLSQSDLRAQLGFGESDAHRDLEIKWPSGCGRSWKMVEADRF